MVEDRVIERGAPYVRYQQIDTLRGFAVLGIYWINIFVFALPALDYLFPPELNDDSLVNSMIGLVSDLYIEGTMRGLFSVLFGASALIFLDEARLATGGLDIIDRYYRRAMTLILFGIIHAYLLLWPYDVLYAYGLFGLFLFPLRKLPVKALLICAVALLVMGDIEIDLTLDDNESISFFSNADVANDDEGSLTKNQEIQNPSQDMNTRTPTTNPNNNATDITNQRLAESESLEEARNELSPEIYLSNYSAIFVLQKSVVLIKQTMTIYEDYIYDIGGMMLLGMALFKMGLLTGQVSTQVYLWLTILGYMSGSAIRFLLDYEGLDLGTVTNVSTGYNLGRVLITLGHIGLVGLLFHSRHFKIIKQALASVGRMALTNYIMQTVISIFLFYGFGFGLYASLERYQLTLVCISVWLFQIVYSHFWLIYFKHGPLEWVWRSLIYGSKQPIRKIAGNS
jgi:uncharacterized protein